jgi:hypothetical protein
VSRERGGQISRCRFGLLENLERRTDRVLEAIGDALHRAEMLERIKLVERHGQLAAERHNLLGTQPDMRTDVVAHASIVHDKRFTGARLQHTGPPSSEMQKGAVVKWLMERVSGGRRHEAYLVVQSCALESDGRQTAAGSAVAAAWTQTSGSGTVSRRACRGCLQAS